jgi:hypothetical protein
LGPRPVIILRAAGAKSSPQPRPARDKPIIILKAAQFQDEPMEDKEPQEPDEVDESTSSSAPEIPARIARPEKPAKPVIQDPVKEIEALIAGAKDLLGAGKGDEAKAQYGRALSLKRKAKLTESQKKNLELELDSLNVDLRMARLG